MYKEKNKGIISLKVQIGLDVVVHTYNPSYARVRDERIMV
jgi:hypothetical protein